MADVVAYAAGAHMEDLGCLVNREIFCIAIHSIKPISKCANDRLLVHLYSFVLWGVGGGPWGFCKHYEMDQRR